MFCTVFWIGRSRQRFVHGHGRRYVRVAAPEERRRRAGPCTGDDLGDRARVTKRPSQTALAPISKTTPALRTPANVYLEGLAETSKPAMRGCLKRIARLVNPEAVVSYLELPWHTLRFEEVRILRRKIIEAYPKPGYANVHLAALRGVLKVAWEMDLLDNFPKLAMQLKRLGGMPLHSGQQVAEDDVHKMFAVAEPRDAALIAVMHGAGLRRVEISRLVRKNYDGEILTAFGKKHSQKRIPLLDMDRPVLDRWCKMLPKKSGRSLDTAPSGREAYQRSAHRHRDEFDPRGHPTTSRRSSTITSRFPAIICHRIVRRRRRYFRSARTYGPCLDRDHCDLRPPRRARKDRRDGEAQ